MQQAYIKFTLLELTHHILNMHTHSNKEATLKPINSKLTIIINYINEASREEELRAHPIKVNKC